MKRQVLAAALVAAALCSAASARADIVDVVYTGTLGYAFDSAGVFGAANTLYTGFAFTARLEFDTTLGALSASPTLNYVRGGSSLGTQSPILSASVTINGKTVSFDPSGYSEVLASNDGSSSAQYNEVSTGTPQTAGYNYLQLEVASPTTALTAALAGPVSFQVAAGDTAGNHFEIDTSATEGVYANFLPETVTVAAAPEPASWALLLAGFAGLGVAGLRRTRAAGTIR